MDAGGHSHATGRRRAAGLTIARLMHAETSDERSDRPFAKEPTMREPEKTPSAATVTEVAEPDDSSYQWTDRTVACRVCHEEIALTTADILPDSSVDPEATLCADCEALGFD